MTSTGTIRAQMLRGRQAARSGSAVVGGRLFSAPGRVNLIGEHTDYNDGFVMPLAIGFDTWVLAVPRGDDQLVVDAVDLNETATHRLGEDLPLQVGVGHWTRYVFGVAESLRQRGVRFGGADLTIHGTVPMGSGLSSSASLEVAVATALTAQALSPGRMTGTELARACQHAENEFVGARCGIMDQYASVHGAEGAAVLLDCRALSHVYVPLGGRGFRVVICNSRVRHQLAGGEYNVRRSQCEAAVAGLQRVYPSVQALRDVSLAQLQVVAPDLDPVVVRRARHVITENARVQTLAASLHDGDLAAVGAAMYASHASLRDDYDVSCPELDLLVELAQQQDGVVGARMTGGGFGGCTVNLVRADAVDAFSAAIESHYRARTGLSPEVHVCDAVAGAGEVHGL